MDVVDPGLDGLERPVIVAVRAVGMMQVAVDEVVNMVTVRNRFVAAPGPVNMIRCMAATIVIRGTDVGVDS